MNLRSLLHNRWFQLVPGVLSMASIAILQYAWTLYSAPVAQHLGASLVVIQYGFTLFVMLQTFVQPFSGWVLDRFGSRLMLIVAGILVGSSWFAMGRMPSVVVFYVLFGLAGIGAAIIYSASTSIAVKWFPDRRGIAAGIITGAYGMGTIPFIPWINRLLEEGSMRSAFEVIGILQIVILVGSALLWRMPPISTVTSKSSQTLGVKPSSMLMTLNFWLIWMALLAMNIGGLVITANAKPMGLSVGIPSAIIVSSVMLNNLANGTGRIFWGFISDRFGRYPTMILSFLLNALFLVALPVVTPWGVWAYVLTLMGVMFTWGQIFSLFPSLTVDLFGTKFASANMALVYSAKGIAGIIGGGLSVALALRYGWNFVFTGAALLSLSSALLIVIVSKRDPKQKAPHRA